MLVRFCGLAALALRAATAFQTIPARRHVRPLRGAKDDAIFGPVGPDIDAWPKAKDMPRTSVELWPRAAARRAFRGVVAATLAVFLLSCLSSVLVALPGVNEAIKGKGALSRPRVFADAVLGQCVTVRRHQWSLGALWDGDAYRRMSRGVALSTQSPLLGDLALDIPITRAQYIARIGQKWRFFTYPLVHGSLGHLLWDAATLRSALALSDKDRGGLPNEFRKVEDPDRLGACGGGGVLVMTLLAGALAGGMGHFRFTLASRNRRAVGCAGLVGALAGARAVAQARLLKRAPNRTALRNLAPRMLVLLVGSAFFAAPTAVALSGCAAGGFVGVCCQPRVVAVEKEFALRGDARDALRQKKARALAVTLSEKVRREPPLLKPWALFAVALVLLPQLRNGLAQLVPALVTAAARPGALSGRSLAFP